MKKMGSKKSPNKCPKCGSPSFEVTKTWQLVAPFPDKDGAITITIMGVMKCSNCGATWRGVVNKIKVGGSKVKVGDKEIEFKEERRGREIIVDIDEDEDEDVE